MRKWKLSQRKEVGVGCVLCQKNEGREAGQKNIPGASPHAYCLILSHSELMENTKNYIHRYTLPRTLLLPKVLTSHWMQQVYHFHTLLSLLSPPHLPTVEQTVRWLNINTRFGHLFLLLKVESGKMRYSNSWLNVLRLVAQSCPTLCDPWTLAQALLSMGILQARVLEWVAMLSSRGLSQPRNWIQVSSTAGRFFYHLSHQGSPSLNSKPIFRAESMT